MSEQTLREALAQVKALVVGDKNPRWTDQHATTATRGRIADICDIALGPTGGVFERAAVIQKASEG
jgi:hypothetical protein